jgi:hypothetical protein
MNLVGLLAETAEVTSHQPWVLLMMLLLWLVSRPLLWLVSRHQPTLVLALLLVGLLADTAEVTSHQPWVLLMMLLLWLVSRPLLRLVSRHQPTLVLALLLVVPALLVVRALLLSLLLLVTLLPGLAIVEPSTTGTRSRLSSINGRQSSHRPPRVG